MTDLINRPFRTGPPRPSEPEPRALTTAGAIGGAVAAAATLVVCLSLALTGWFLADAGAHGETTDALRVGADGWLLGHGARMTVAGTPLGITPLAVTLMLLLGAFRAGRWSAASAARATDDRAWAFAVATFAGSYLVLLTVVGVLAPAAGANPSLSRALLGGLLISVLSGGLGLAVGSGRTEVWLDRVPAWTRELLAGGIAGALGLVAAAAGLVILSLLLSFNEAATALSELHLSAGDALAYTVVGALLVPNAVLLSAAYLLGPGFAVGVGTSVSPSAVTLGVVPAFPLLAALPDEGPTPGWMMGLLAVPALAAALGVALSRRGHDPVPYDLAAARGAGSGFLAGVLVTLAIALAGGPMGTGRLAEIGAPGAEVLVFATGLMAGGGLIGGLLVTAAQRWRIRRRG